MAFVDLGDQFIALSAGRSQPADGRRHIGLVVDDREATLAAAAAAGARARRRQRLPRPVGQPLAGRRLPGHPVHEDRRASSRAWGSRGSRSPSGRSTSCAQGPRGLERGHGDDNRSPKHAATTPVTHGGSGRGRIPAAIRGARATGLRGRLPRRRPANLIWVMPAEERVQGEQSTIVVVAAGSGRIRPSASACRRARTSWPQTAGSTARSRSGSSRRSRSVTSTRSPSRASPWSRRPVAGSSVTPRRRTRPTSSSRSTRRSSSVPTRIVVVADPGGRLDHLLAGLLLLGSRAVRDARDRRAPRRRHAPTSCAASANARGRRPAS